MYYLTPIQSKSIVYLLDQQLQIIGHIENVLNANTKS